MVRSFRAAEEPREAVARGGLREGEAAVEPRHVYAEMESESCERLAMFSRRTCKFHGEPKTKLISKKIHIHLHRYIHRYKHKFMVIIINECFF